MSPLPSAYSPERVDVLVIGGGIQGAGIAQAAAAAGFSTLLVEKTNWAAGTSSRSSKLVHGGLRYLSQFQLGLVYSSLRERRILRRIAPHLVRLNNFYIPVYKDSSIRPWQLWLGLSLYALLGGFRESNRFTLIPRKHWHMLEGLKTDGLQAVFQYQDAQTDDAELTKAVVRSAIQLGAMTSCPAEFLSATKTTDGYEVNLREKDMTRSMTCRIMVNASGPWTERVADRITPPPKKYPFELVQGSHLVLNQRLSDQCFYLEAPGDARPVFVLPWKSTTLLGTTETPYQGDPGQVSCLQSEERYLLETLKHYFPAYAARVDVVDKMAGLRVLPTGSEGLHSRSRDAIIHHETLMEQGYLSVYGGKLTEYRATAAAVVKLITETLGKRGTKADTAVLQLPSV